jgi:hypothetical protein
MVMIERFRNWLHRECRLERSNASALISVGEQLGALSGGVLLLRQAFERVPERVTVIAYGQREAGESPIVVDSKTVRLRGERTETITLETHFPIDVFQVVVMADFDRVELAGLFHGANLMGMQSPIAFGKSWKLGEYVRAVVRRLEVGS